MKKKLLVLTIVLIFVMCGCQIQKDANTVDQQDNNPIQTIETTDKSYISYITENISIIIRDLNQIDNMKAILYEDDEAKASDALRKLQGVGLKSKKDLVRFLEVVNDLPTLDLIEGEISAISYMKGLTEDTGKEYEFAYISVKAKDGGWVRFEYLLSEDTFPATNGTISSTDQAITVFSKPIDAADGKVKIFSEQSKNHSSGIGKLFTWNANINGKNAKIIYYYLNDMQLNTAEVFSDVKVLMVNEDI